MKKILALSLLSVAVIVTGCSSDTSRDTTVVSGAVEVPEPATLDYGTRLQTIAEHPLTSWIVDTVRGVCQPDSMVLFVVHDGTEYMTNVGWVDRSVSCLTVNGNRALRDGTLGQLRRSDFHPQAVIIKNPWGSRRAFVQYCDSVYSANVRDMMRIAEDFFLSYGMTKYMAEPVASSWRRVYADADAGGYESANPFNSGTDIRFRDGSVEVTLADAARGRLEVKAYCEDRCTLPQPGWAYWTVWMTREGGYYKLLRAPARHRQF